MPKNNDDKISSILSSIDDSLKQQNSPKRVFTQGLIRGFGTALGATVVLALLTSITLKLSDTLSANTVIEYFFNDAVQD